jgi:uncharacterized phage infection (PIP) family protein YhgE
MIFKNLVLQALGTIRIRFLQKKYFKKIHAFVPLSRLVKFFNLVRATPIEITNTLPLNKAFTLIL